MYYNLEHNKPLKHRASAVSMYGQLACWVMKIWYAVLIVILV